MRNCPPACRCSVPGCSTDLQRAGNGRPARRRRADRRQRLQRLYLYRKTRHSLHGGGSAGERVQRLDGGTAARRRDLRTGSGALVRTTAGRKAATRRSPTTTRARNRPHTDPFSEKRRRALRVSGAPVFCRLSRFVFARKPPEKPAGGNSFKINRKKSIKM